MFRRVDKTRRARGMFCAGALLVLLCAGGRWATARQTASSQTDPFNDGVVDYLEHLQLNDLVAARLEQTLNDTLGDDRVALAERLAVLYGQLLDESSTQDERRMWEERSKALLENVPKADTEVLRLNIHKASYLRAEHTAELYRLRAVDESERLDALRLMTETAQVFTDAHADYRSRIQRLETSDISDPRRASAVEKELAHLHDLALQCAYYGAWALYYKDWLGGTEEGLDRAVRLFGWQLQFDGEEPIVEEVSIDYVAYEHMARAILGVALCHSLAGRPSTALDWFRLINEADTTNERVRAMLPGYEILLLFQARRWNDVEDAIARFRTEEKYTLTMARLTAVLALSRSIQTSDERVRQIGEEALTYLAQEGAMDQVAEISEVFDFASLSGDSFAVSYVLAVKAYDKAREAHGSEEPTSDAPVIELYREAQKLLRQTISRVDSARWVETARSASMLVGMSLYYTGEFEAAAREFIDVARRSTEAQSEEAIWMAVVARDRNLALAPDDPERKTLLQSVMDSYLRRFPSSARAGRLRLRRVITSDQAPTTQEIDELLTIPRESEAYESAQQEAERRLYELLRTTSPGNRLGLINKYLDLALPRLDEAQRRVVSAQASAKETEEYLLLARRVLDVLLMPGVARIDEARQVLDRIETARAAGLIQVDSIRDELEYRWFEIDLRMGRMDEAEQRAAAIWQRSPGHVYAMAASRSLYGQAAQDWHAFPEGPNVERTLRRVVEHGQRSVRLKANEPDLGGDASPLTVLTVGEAALELYHRTQDADMFALAKSWIGALYAAQPNTYTVLRAWAQVSEASDELDSAIEAWRTAMNGSKTGEDHWFESKYHFVRLLLKQDPDRAREVLRQHVLLYPNFGPDPWGPRFRALNSETGNGGGGG